MSDQQLTPRFVIPSLRANMVRLQNINLTMPQKVTVLAVSLGIVLLGGLTRYFRRHRHAVKSAASVRRHSSTRRGRNAQAVRGANGDIGHGRRSLSPGSNRALVRQNSISGTSDRLSTVSTVTTVGGGEAQLTPQQIGLMGMEALETAVGYWEDALSAYTSTSATKRALTTKEEAEFNRHLERLLDLAYSLQDESETLFLHQPIVFRPERVSDTPNRPLEFDRRTISSISSPESFVSAQEEVANLRDFEDYPELLVDGANFHLYQDALRHLENHDIPYRYLRTELVHCNSDAEYLAKLHCVRLAFQFLFHNETHRQWFCDAGRNVLVGLLIKAEKDPKDFLKAYEEGVSYVQDSSNLETMATELHDRGLRIITFFDVVFDYIFMDAFEDLEKPPSSVVAVMQNRWLSNGFKETAMTTVLWSILRAKRSLLKYPDGFKSRFYDIMEHVMPPVAWGFMGPDENLKEMCMFFKDQVNGFLTDIFSFKTVRFTKVEELADDIMTAARSRYHAVEVHLDLHDILNGATSNGDDEFVNDE